MTYRGPMLRAVAAAIASADIKPEDAGTVALARRYAALIDEATPKSAYAEHLRKVRVALSPLDDDAEKALTRIADALAAHSVMSDLGPKLLAALTALGLAPAARGAKGKGGRQGVGPASTGEPCGTCGGRHANKLEELRAHRGRTG